MGSSDCRGFTEKVTEKLTRNEDRLWMEKEVLGWGSSTYQVLDVGQRRHLPQVVRSSWLSRVGIVAQKLDW